MYRLLMIFWLKSEHNLLWSTPDVDIKDNQKICSHRIECIHIWLRRLMGILPFGWEFDDYMALVLVEKIPLYMFRDPALFLHSSYFLSSWFVSLSDPFLLFPIYFWPNLVLNNLCEAINASFRVSEIICSPGHLIATDSRLLACLHLA